VIGPRTWRKLMKVHPDMVNWSRKRSGHGKLSPVRGPSAPRSASLPAVRYEIPTTGRR